VIVDHILAGNNIDTLKMLPDNYVHCCVTSPPYFGLRDYETAQWIGGDVKCNHVNNSNRDERPRRGLEGGLSTIGAATFYKTICGKCGAIRNDSQIGLEETPEAYIQKLVDIFREVKRVLRDDGTLWVNIGDTYAGSGNGGAHYPDATIGCKQGTSLGTINKPNLPQGKTYKGIKAKDLIGIPWALAFALREDGYYLRQDIIWHKPNPMPESVTDRCTKSHEYLFLFSKSKNYYFDNTAIREIAIENKDIGLLRGKSIVDDKIAWHSASIQKRKEENINSKTAGTGYRNKRDVWTVPTESLGVEHFAVFPQKLILPCILCGCPENGIVLDPFLGSGTTAVVAVKNFRRYIGCELNPEYIKIAEQRISDEMGLFNEVST